MMKNKKSVGRKKGDIDSDEKVLNRHSDVLTYLRGLEIAELKEEDMPMVNKGVKTI